MFFQVFSHLSIHLHVVLQLWQTFLILFFQICILKCVSLDLFDLFAIHI